MVPPFGCLSPHSWDGEVAPLLKILADGVEFSSVEEYPGDNFIVVAVAALGGVNTLVFVVPPKDRPPPLVMIVPVLASYSEGVTGWALTRCITCATLPGGPEGGEGAHLPLRCPCDLPLVSDSISLLPAWMVPLVVAPIATCPLCDAALAAQPWLQLHGRNISVVYHSEPGLWHHVPTAPAPLDVADVVRLTRSDQEGRPSGTCSPQRASGGLILLDHHPGADESSARVE